MRIQRFVLDTSVFTTYEGNKKSIEKHILELIDLIVEGRTKGISCYFPPSTWKELVGILEKKGIPKEKIEKLDAWTIEKNPSVLELTIPAKFLEDYLLENFERINKGLRETEKIISLAKEKPEEECIKLLRKKYREAVRKGIIDSKEELDA
ncbi:MAG: RNA ligase partner protein, partial [archaeon]